MERIRKFNLELSLFVKELKLYTQNVNEIDDETVKLLSETIITVNKLQIDSNFRETSTLNNNNNNNFVNRLNDEIFECRRIIVCCLCHEQISLNADEFNVHIQKNSHKEKETKRPPINAFFRGSPLFYSHQAPLMAPAYIANHSNAEQIVEKKNVHSINTVANVARDERSENLKGNAVNTFKTASKSSSMLSLNSESSTKNSESEISQSSLSSLQNLKDAVASVEVLKNKYSSAISNTSNRSSASLDQNASPDASSNVVSNSTGLSKLESMVNANEITKFIHIEMNQLLLSSPNRFKLDADIIYKLTNFVRTRFTVETFSTFGSTTYGFVGPKTDLNIIVAIGFPTATDDLDDLDDFDYFLQDTLQTKQWIKRTGQLQDFDFLCRTKENRVQCAQLKFLHKKSGIPCSIELSQRSNIYRVQLASKIIRDYISLHPMCKQLITFVKAWQIVMNDVATKNGLTAFHFNTYIISALVIFHFQMNHKLPKLNELESTISNKVSFSTKATLGQFAMEFFEFYGNAYIYNTHLISLHVGRWQQKVQKKQKNFTPEQRSMRDGIKACPSNWNDCAMCVQDFVSPSINITAEVSLAEVDNFVKMCKLFAKHSQQLESLTCQSIPCADEDLVALIEKEINDSRFPPFLEDRRKFKLEIGETLTKYVQQFDKSFKIIPFGSSRFGIKLHNNNFNLLINTNGREMPPQSDLKFSVLFHIYLKNSDISKYFTEIVPILANRTLVEQISMVHIKSRIQCILLFDKDDTIVESAKIIRRYAEDPLCKFLITFVRMWQFVLNQKGIACLEFNTYIISVLVIFFLQVDHGFPTVDQILGQDSSIDSKASYFKPILGQFFAFYGHRYQMQNHVISAHIGRWQERQMQSEQKNFSTAQQRLRKGMEESPNKWNKYCTMCVQDLVRPDINITADVSAQNAEMFQEMCKNFAKILS